MINFSDEELLRQKTARVDDLEAALAAAEDGHRLDDETIDSLRAAIATRDELIRALMDHAWIGVNNGRTTVELPAYFYPSPELADLLREILAMP